MKCENVLVGVDSDEDVARGSMTAKASDQVQMCAKQLKRVFTDGDKGLMVIKRVGKVFIDKKYLIWMAEFLSALSKIVVCSLQLLRNTTFRWLKHLQLPMLDND